MDKCLKGKCTMGKYLMSKYPIVKCLIGKCSMGKCLIVKCPIVKYPIGTCSMGKCLKANVLKQYFHFVSQPRNFIKISTNIVYIEIVLHSCHLTTILKFLLFVSRQK